MKKSSLYNVFLTFLVWWIMEELCTKNQTNPWLVEELEEFLYFCCPECDEKCRAKDLFLKHAFCQHPNVSYVQFYFYGCASASHLGPAFFFVLPSCWSFRCRHVGVDIVRIVMFVAVMLVRTSSELSCLLPSCWSGTFSKFVIHMYYVNCFKVTW